MGTQNLSALVLYLTVLPPHELRGLGDKVALFKVLPRQSGQALAWVCARETETETDAMLWVRCRSRGAGRLWAGLLPRRDPSGRDGICPGGTRVGRAEWKASSKQTPLGTLCNSPVPVQCPPLPEGKSGQDPSPHGPQHIPPSLDLPDMAWWCPGSSGHCFLEQRGWSRGEAQATDSAGMLSRDTAEQGSLPG
jgi:hypothetical protein